MAIVGAVGSGKTSACMHPFARQLLGWQATNPERRAAALVLEVKGDFCHDIRRMLTELDRGGDYIELSLDGRLTWNPRRRYRPLRRGDRCLRWSVYDASADQLRLERLVASALPASGAVVVSGSMLLRRASGSPPFVVHVKLVAVPQPDYGARHVAARIPILEPRSQHWIDPDLVARTLALTPMGSRVAVWLAEGKTVRDMAEATGRTQGSIYWHLKQLYRKQPISRPVDLGAPGVVQSPSSGSSEPCTERLDLLPTGVRPSSTQ